MSNDQSHRPPPNLGGVRPQANADPARAGRGGPRRPIDREPPSLGAPPPPRPAGPAKRPAPATMDTDAAVDFRGPRTIYRKPEGEERSRSRLGAVLLYGFLGLVGLIVAAAGLLLLVPPTDLIRDKVIAEVKARTGRNLVVESARLTLLPSIGVSLKTVTLSGPSTMPGPPLLTAGGIDVSVALLPLITREVQVQRLVLFRPVLDLRVDERGRRNWDFAEAEPLRQPYPVRYAQVVPPRGQEFRKLPIELQDFARNASPPTKPDLLAGLSALSLSDVRITDGTVRYTDQRAGVNHEAKAIHVRAGLKDLGGPLVVSGDLDYSKARLSVDATLHSVRDLIAERPSRVTLKLAGQPMTASYDGQVTPGPAVVLDGRISVATPSALALARFLRAPIPGIETIGALGLEGQIKTAANSFSVNNGSYTIGDLTATGALGFDIEGGRPQIKATLKIPALDLDRLAEATANLPGSPAAPQAEPLPLPTPPAAGGAPRSIEDLIRQSDDAQPGRAGPAVKGFTKRKSEGWSQEAMEFGLFRLADVEGRFAIGELVARNMRLQQVQLGLDLKGGVLKGNLQEAALYGGRARGLVTFDARKPQGILSLNLQADGVEAGRMLKDSADIDLVEGKGRVLVTVNGTGGSERELVGTLAGKAEFKVGDGALLGWNATDMIAQVQQLKLPSLDRRAGARTAFTDFSGSFQIANGVGRTQDLKLESAQLRATGTGVVNLVDRNLDLMVRPKAASGGLANIDVPLRIAGNFDAVSVVPQVKESETLKQLGRQVREGDVDKVVRGVLGNGPEAEEKAAKAKEALRKFLNR